MKFFSFPGFSKRSIILVFLLKILVGIILLLIYTKYYPDSDAQAYFNDGKIMHDAIWQHPSDFFKMFSGFDSADNTLNVYYSKMNCWNASFENVLFNDARTIIRLNALFHFFSFGIFYVHIVFMCFLSLIGLTAFYKAFSPYFINKKKILFVSVFLLPSVLFWGSGVLKEGLLFFAIGLLLYLTECGFAKKYSFGKMISVFLLISVLLFVKFYFLIALIPGLIANSWISRTSIKATFVKYITVYACFVLLSMLVSILKPEWDPLKIIVNKQQKSEAIAKGGLFLLGNDYFVRFEYNDINIALIPVKERYFRIKPNSSYDAWKINNLKDTLRINNSTDTTLYKLMYKVSPSNSAILSLKLRPTFSSILMHMPAAFYNTIAKPLNFFTKDILKFCSSVENWFYITCILLGAICFKFPKENAAIICFCFSVFAFIFVLAGLTTPIVGSLVRYKTPALPFMMIFIFMLTDTDKLRKIPIVGKYLFN